VGEEIADERLEAGRGLSLRRGALRGHCRHWNYFPRRCFVPA
jgi:hypothetical protein